MKNTFGSSVTLTLFGESHGEAIGAVLDGVAPGIPVDTDYIEKKLALRRPDGETSTSRREADRFVIESGVFEGFTTGTPVCILIPNGDTKSSAYEKTRYLPRPGHADYTAHVKYCGFADYRGGGHFSGRLTAAVVAVGAVIQGALEKCGIVIGSHLLSVGGERDAEMMPERDLSRLSEMAFPVVDSEAGERMKQAILLAKEEGDSVGGILETAVTGVPAGLGEPWFDTVEGLLSKAVFSIPAVKGVEFGDGFALASMRAKEANDGYRIKDGKTVTETNHAGGVLGGISNGAPIVFRVAVKPTPSIAMEQNTVDLKSGTNATLSVKGRHDPCVAHRARAGVEALTALVIADLLAQRFGTDVLRSGDFSER